MMRLLRTPVVYFQTPGMSWPREMRPTPMAPMLMRFDGASWPKTEEGTRVGKTMTAAAPRPVFKNVLRVCVVVAILARSSGPVLRQQESKPARGCLATYILGAEDS